MGKKAAGAADVVSVPDGVVAAAMGAIAAVLEEPHCYAGSKELRQLVRAFRGLSRAYGIKPDYAWRDGRVVSAHDAASVIKDVRGVTGIDVKLAPVPRQRLNALPARDEAAT